MSGSGVKVSIDPPDATVVGERALAKEIVVTVGDSPAALDRAVEQSRRTGVRLRIVHAWQMTAAPSGQADESFWVASGADARAGYPLGSGRARRRGGKRPLDPRYR